VNLVHPTSAVNLNIDSNTHQLLAQSFYFTAYLSHSKAVPKFRCFVFVFDRRHK
jgi:hypothetical protein